MSVNDKKKIIEIMKKNCLHAYLATCEGKKPRVRPVTPIVSDDMSIWITCFASSRKVNQIKHNHKVCLAFVQQPAGDKSATVIGNANIVKDLNEKKKAWKLAKFNLYDHFPDGPESKGFCLLKITPDFIEWRDSWKSELKIYKPK